MSRFTPENEPNGGSSEAGNRDQDAFAQLMSAMAVEAQKATVPSLSYKEDTEYLSQLTAAGVDINQPCYIPRSLLEVYLNDSATLQNWAEQEGLILL